MTLRLANVPCEVIGPDPAATSPGPGSPNASPPLGRAGLAGDELRDDFVKWLAVQRSRSDSVDWRRRKFGVGERERPFHSLDGAASSGGDEDYDEDEDDEVLLGGFYGSGDEKEPKADGDKDKGKKMSAAAALFSPMSGEPGEGPRCPFEALFRSHFGATNSFGTFQDPK